MKLLYKHIKKDFLAKKTMMAILSLFLMGTSFLYYFVHFSVDKNLSKYRNVDSATLAANELKYLTALENNLVLIRYMTTAMIAVFLLIFFLFITNTLFGVFNVTKSLIAYFIKRKKGAIVSVASIAGLTGIAGQTNYCASKSGIIGFTKSLAMETAKYGVRVNAVAPGYIKTDMTAAINEKAKEKMYSLIPMGREGTVEEVASVVEVLLSDAASYITGQVISIDGGITA